jgi:hypothetical protein
MSKHTKVNKTNYVQAGRLTPDDLARERAREIYMSDTRRKVSASRQSPAAKDAAPAPNRARNEREEEE